MCKSKTKLNSDAGVQGPKGEESIQNCRSSLLRSGWQRLCGRVFGGDSSPRGLPAPAYGTKQALTGFGRTEDFSWARAVPSEMQDRRSKLLQDSVGAQVLPLGFLLILNFCQWPLTLFAQGAGVPASLSWKVGVGRRGQTRQDLCHLLETGGSRDVGTRAPSPPPSPHLPPLGVAISRLP